MISAVELWDRIKPSLRRQMVFTPEAWRSVETAVPITLDQNTFVLGLSLENEHLRSHLETGTMISLIQQALREFLGKEMEVAVISGTTEEDWQRHKFHKEHLKKLTEQTAEAVSPPKPTERDWRWFFHELSQAYLKLPNHQYDYVKAQFLLDWVEKISEFEDDYLSRHPEKHRDILRELEWLVQKMSSMFNLTASAIALEIERFRRSRQTVKS